MKNKYHPDRIKNLTIDRKTWGNGNNHHGGSLLDGQGFRCCLSFYAEEAGIKLNKMKYRGMPSSLFGVRCPPALECLIDKEEDRDENDNKISKNLAKVNDSKYFSPKKRESRIKELFAQIGVKVKFIN